MERGNRRIQYLIVSSVCTSAVSIGVSFLWSAPVLPKIARNEVGFQITKDEISWMVSISSIGFVLGSCLARITSDRFGRRATILGSAIPIIVGSILMIAAWEAWLLSAGRFLWGCGTGMLVAVVGIYIAEIADKEIRGQLALTNRFMLSFGGLLVITVGTFVSYQTLNFLLLVLPVFFLAACSWIPESPYYLLKQGKVEAAKKTIQSLRGIQDEDVLDEKLSQLHSLVKTEMMRSSSLKEFLTGKRYRKAIFIVLGMKIPQIMSGIHAIQNYLGPILMDSKTGMNISTAVILYGTIRFLLGIMSSVLVDRIGRRPLLISTFIGTGVFFVINSVYFALQEKYGFSYPYNLIPFIVIMMTIIISVLGFESVVYLMPSELFPMNVKSIALASTSMLGGFFNFASVKSYQQIKDWLGLTGVFGSYALATFIGAGFCYFLVPETKGKSLKEIQIELNGDIYGEEEKLKTISAHDGVDVPLKKDIESKDPVD